MTVARHHKKVHQPSFDPRSVPNLRAAEIDVDLASQIIDIVKTKGIGDLDISKMIMDIQIERTMSGASNITYMLEDPERKLMNHKYIKDGNAFRIKLDDWWYRMYGQRKTSDEFDIVFEDQAVAYLRQMKKLVKANRAHETRAQFCAHLVKLAGHHIRVYAPEEMVKQAIEPLSKQDQQTVYSQTTAGGFDKKANVTVKHQSASAHQLKVISETLDVGVGLGARTKVLVSAIMTITQESSCDDRLRNYLTITVPGHQGAPGMPGVAGGTKRVPDPRQSQGAFQQIKIDGWPATGDIKKDAPAYYKKAIEIDKEQPHLELWALCQAVQGSAHPTLYDQWKKEAQHTVQEYHAGNLAGAGVQQTFTHRLPYYFSTKNDDGHIEDFWTTIQRLMSEVQWAAWAQQGIIYLAREMYLIHRRPFATISPDDPGIDDIDFDWNINKSDATATITARAKRWAAPPGSVVILQDLGVADDRWLVDSITRSAFEPTATISLRKPNHALKEPAPDTENITKLRPIRSVGEGPSDVKIGSTPKEIIDAIVLPMGRRHHMLTAQGLPLTPDNVTKANAAHGPTVDGNVSDHQGPPNVAWAVDMSNGYETVDEYKLANELAQKFGIDAHFTKTTGGLFNATHDGYRYQLIHNTTEGGNHYNHVHFGVRIVNPGATHQRGVIGAPPPR